MTLEQENVLRSDKLESKHKVARDLSLFLSLSMQLSFSWHAI